MSDSAIPGRPVWIDLITSDTAAAQAFYGSLFGWTFTDTGADFGHYHIIDLGGKAVGGLMGRVPEMADAPGGWNVYLHTDDTTETARRAAEHGTVPWPAESIGDMGTMGSVVDPTGGATGFWQPGSFAGTEVVVAAGAPCWYEYLTRDFDASADFFTAVFDWPLTPMPDELAAGAPEGFRYATAGAGDDAVAGLLTTSFVPADAPGTWRVYLGATDVDAATARIAELGGHVLEAAQDSPFGRMAAVADPEGHGFLLTQVAG